MTMHIVVYAYLSGQPLAIWCNLFYRTHHTILFISINSSCFVFFQINMANFVMTILCLFVYDIY